MLKKIFVWKIARDNIGSWNRNHTKKRKLIIQCKIVNNTNKTTKIKYKKTEIKSLLAIKNLQ